jgi:hypothetical protein
VVAGEFVEHLAHRTWVAAHDGVRGENVALSVEALSVERVSGVCGE